MSITKDNVGIFVDGWWGRYGIARAVTILRALGWEPEDGKTIDALVLTLLDAMAMNDTLASTTREARIAAGLPDIADVPEGAEREQVEEFLTFAMDDGIIWANQIADDGLYVGWEDGQFGIFNIEEKETH